MSKRVISIMSLLFAGTVLLSAGLPGTPARSSYIGKRFMSFEMNNGPSYKWKKLKDGGSLQWWRSDLAGCCTGRWDDGQGNRCELLIQLDANKVIRTIRILEDGIACGIALR